MTSINSEKILKYLKIQERLLSQRLCKGIFLYAPPPLPPLTIYKHKVKKSLNICIELVKTLRFFA